MGRVRRLPASDQAAIRLPTTYAEWWAWTWAMVKEPSMAFGMRIGSPDLAGTISARSAFIHDVPVMDS